MVGGVIYFRGSIDGYSERDVKLLEISEQDWQWLCDNLKPYLTAIERMDYYHELTKSPDEWRKLVPYTPQERRRKRWFKVEMEDSGKTTGRKRLEREEFCRIH